jgi:hypothetical protein
MSIIGRHGDAQRFPGEHIGCPLVMSLYPPLVDSAELLRYPGMRYGKLAHGCINQYNRRQSNRFHLRHVGGPVRARWMTDHLSGRKAHRWSVLLCRSSL